MNTAVKSLLDEAKRLVDGAERDRAEEIMQRVADLEDNDALRNSIEGMKGALLNNQGGGGFGGAVASSGFDLKARPSVYIPLASILSKANDFPEVGEWAPTRPVTVQLGQDKRFLYPFLPTTNVEGASAEQDFKQSARTLTGTVKRALDATSDKANVDVTLALVTENLSQFAVTMNDVPNAILESIDLMRQFLNSEGRFRSRRRWTLTSSPR